MRASTAHSRNDTNDVHPKLEVERSFALRAGHIGGEDHESAGGQSGTRAGRPSVCGGARTVTGVLLDRAGSQQHVCWPRGFTSRARASAQADDGSAMRRRRTQRSARPNGHFFRASRSRHPAFSSTARSRLCRTARGRWASIYSSRCSMAVRLPGLRGARVT